MNGVEPGELINLIASSFLLAYIFYLQQKHHVRIDYFWLLGAFSLIIANLATVLESFFYSYLFNFIEHFAFAICAFSFMVGVIFIKKKDSNAKHYLDN